MLKDMHMFAKNTDLYTGGIILLPVMTEESQMVNQPLVLSGLIKEFDRI